MHHEEVEFRRALRALRLEVPASVMDDVEEKFNALMATVLTPSGERWKHEKRGSVYDIFAIGHANSAAEYIVSDRDRAEIGDSLFEDLLSDGVAGWATSAKKVLFDRDEVVVYRDVQTGTVSVRTTKEFLDGRFTVLPARPGGGVVDATRALSKATEDTAGTAPAPSRTRASTSVDTMSERKVIYVGPQLKFRGQIGVIKDWSEGYVEVQWIESPNYPGCPEARQNALNIQLVSTEE